MTDVVTLRCPTCHHRLAIWDGRALAMVRGQQKVNTRRGPRQAVKRATGSAWGWQRMFACWTDDGVSWSFHLSNDAAPAHGNLTASNVEEMASLCGFSCCGHQFSLADAISVAKIAERRGRASTNLRVPPDTIRSDS